eukprot:232286_1
MQYQGINVNNCMHKTKITIQFLALISVQFPSLLPPIAIRSIYIVCICFVLCCQFQFSLCQFDVHVLSLSHQRYTLSMLINSITIHPLDLLKYNSTSFVVSR